MWEVGAASSPATWHSCTYSSHVFYYHCCYLRRRVTATRDRLTHPSVFAIAAWLTIQTIDEVTTEPRGRTTRLPRRPNGTTLSYQLTAVSSTSDRRQLSWFVETYGITRYSIYSYTIFSLAYALSATQLRMQAAYELVVRWKYYSSLLIYFKLN